MRHEIWLTGTGFLLSMALAFIPSAKAQTDDQFDPAFVETLTNNCPSNCQAVHMALDPVSGMTTLEFTFYNNSNVTAGHAAIPNVVQGDVNVTEFGSSTVGDVVRFENISGSAVAFIYSSDTQTGLAADVGLPPAFPNLTNTVTIGENSAGFAPASGLPYVPASGQPGYCGTCSTQPGYGLISTDLPEPGTLSLFGSACALALWRKATRRKV